MIQKTLRYFSNKRKGKTQPTASEERVQEDIMNVAGFFKEEHEKIFIVFPVVIFLILYYIIT